MLYFNQNIFNKYKAKSIKSLLEFVPGETYYSNINETFIFNNLGFRHDGRWDARITKVVNARDGWLCAGDLNIGASYNPWMVFKNKQDAEDCLKELRVSYEPDDDEDFFASLEGDYEGVDHTVD